MGRFTHLEDPRVDSAVENDLQQIVQSILSSVQAQSIILYGSFARGEGSIVFEEDGSLNFLSDYELMVVTPDFQDRGILHRMADDLTRRLGVETSISRLSPPDPDNKRAVSPTIMMYEMQHGGMSLYGPPLPSQAMRLEARQINPWSGLRLLFNRLADLLQYLPFEEHAQTDLTVLRFINKTILASAEAVLVASGSYHYSYAERGRLFANLEEQLRDVTPYAREFTDLVSRATQFKLRPSRQFYQEPLPILLEQVKRACDASLRFVVSRALKFTFRNYAKFPALYKKNLLAQNLIQQKKWPILPAAFSQNLYVGLRYFHDQRRLSLRQMACVTYPAQHIVYSVIPLLLFEENGVGLTEARRWLSKVMFLNPVHNNTNYELAYLRSCAVQAWKNYCYGLWEIL